MPPGLQEVLPVLPPPTDAENVDKSLSVSSEPQLGHFIVSSRFREADLRERWTVCLILMGGSIFKKGLYVN